MGRGEARGAEGWEGLEEGQEGRGVQACDLNGRPLAVGQAVEPGVPVEDPAHGAGAGAGGATDGLDYLLKQVEGRLGEQILMRLPEAVATPRAGEPEHQEGVEEDRQHLLVGQIHHRPEPLRLKGVVEDHAEADALVGDDLGLCPSHHVGDGLLDLLLDGQGVVRRHSVDLGVLEPLALAQLSAIQLSGGDAAGAALHPDAHLIEGELLEVPGEPTGPEQAEPLGVVPLLVQRQQQQL
ncbi:hypothetical protein CMI47_11775 [Candidatus Pacearchaeota archaeon]|nr:hypothetical protein [Candidatus Pacearchaeota archaeon]